MSLETIIEAQGQLVISDVHGKMDTVKKALSYSAANDYALTVNGDIVNDYSFTNLISQMGYKSPNEIQMEYLSQNLSQNDLQTFILARNAAQYGIDAILNQVPQAQRKEAQKQIEEVLKYSQTELFQKRVQNIAENMMLEKGEEMQNNALKMRALYEVFMDEEAKRFANELNNYSEVKVLFNKGNHENVYFVEQVRQYLDNQEQIIDLNEHKGYVTLKSKSGLETTLAAMTNSAQMMPYLSEIFSEEELYQLYSHMLPDENKMKSMMFGDQSIEELKQLESIYKEDWDYKRIKEQNADKDLDIFLTHGQVGKPMTNNNRAYDVPYYASAAALSLESKLTVEGHIHSNYEGQNSFGVDMVRAAGSDAAIIEKDENGQIQTTWLKIDETHDGNHSNPIPYSIEYLQMRVDDLVKQYEIMIAQAQNQVQNPQSSKAA
ncbi:MAG: hypothetical protein KC589_09485 [Nanoarchaeota archaeon]|nr:hypothetical protein [Nanoarchaeota archaeon]